MQRFSDAEQTNRGCQLEPRVNIRGCCGNVLGLDLVKYFLELRCGPALVGVRWPTAPQSLLTMTAVYSDTWCSLWSHDPLSPSFCLSLRGENCGKYFVFPESQAMYLLQVLLNEL